MDYEILRVVPGRAEADVSKKNHGYQKAMAYRKVFGTYGESKALLVWDASMNQIKDRTDRYVIEWVKDWLADWLTDWVTECRHACMHACMHEQTNEWMNELMNETNRNESKQYKKKGNEMKMKWKWDNWN